MGTEKKQKSLLDYMQMIMSNPRKITISIEHREKELKEIEKFRQQESAKLSKKNNLNIS